MEISLTRGRTYEVGQSLVGFHGANFEDYNGSHSDVPLLKHNNGYSVLIKIFTSNLFLKVIFIFEWVLFP